MGKIRLAFLGCGFLNEVVAYALENGILPDYELVGAFARTEEKTKRFAKRHNCKACYSIEALMELKPDYVAEAASRHAVWENAETILKNGAGLILLSIGALAEEDFFEKIKNTAKEHGTKIHIASGTVGGFDILRSTTLMGGAKTSFTSYRSPASIYYTPFFREEILKITEPQRVYAGNTKEAISLLPGQVNVAVATALASSGPAGTEMNIDAVPGFRGDLFRTEITGKVAHAELNIYSSDYSLAGWSVVAVLQNIAGPVVFG